MHVTFTVALFAISEAWKQPKCPSVGEWIKKILYLYTEYFSTLKKKEIMLFATTS